MTDFKRFVMPEDDTYGEDATLIDRDTNKIFYDNFSDMVDVMNEINLIALHRSDLYIAADMLINDLGSDELKRQWDETVSRLYRKWQEDGVV